MNAVKRRMDLLVFCNQLNMIGPRCLSSYLKSRGIDVRIIYMISPADSFENIFSEGLYDQVIESCVGSDLIGMSLTTNYFPEARKLTLKLKERLDIPVVWGGVHPTIETEEGLEFADYVIRGEGEAAVYELIDALTKDGDISGIRNLAFKSDGMVIKNPLRPLEGVDDLPMPDLDFTSHYLVDDGRMKRISTELMKKYMLTFSNKKRITYNIATTRGCPHSCTYCVNYAYKEMFGAKGYVRKRSAGKIIEELTAALEEYPFIEYIFIADETFFIQRIEIIREFARLYRQKIKLPLKIEFSPQTYQDEKLACMLEAGAVELHMGVESGSDDTNYDIYRRNFPVNRIKGILDSIDRHSGSLEVVHLHILICNPFEKPENTRQTFRFVADISNHFHIRFFPLVLFPGTKLLAMAEEAGLIRNREQDVYLKTWNIAQAMKSADYYTLCMIFLYKLKRKFKLSRFQCLLFYYLMSFPAVRSIMGSRTGKKALAGSYIALQRRRNASPAGPKDKNR